MQEAAARLRELTRSPYRADTLDDPIYRDGQAIGYRYPGSSERIQTVSRDEFDEMIGKILGDPRWSAFRRLTQIIREQVIGCVMAQ